jgi:hypothetical protein
MQAIQAYLQNLSKIDEGSNLCKQYTFNPGIKQAAGTNKQQGS